MSWNNGKHIEYNKQDWSKKPSIFAESIIWLFPNSGKILEIGSGLGQDSRFFRNQWYEVYSTDYSIDAIRFNIEKSSSEILTGKYHCQQVDITNWLPFADWEFDIVYAHLSLHYFSKKITQEIITEVNRVLKKWGIFSVFLNSIEDPEYGIGTLIEDDYFEIRWVPKRYFSVETTRELFWGWFNIELLDNLWETYKDREKWIHNLIRFVWSKI